MINGFKTGFLTSDKFSEQDFTKTCTYLKELGYDAIEPTAPLFSPRTHSPSKLSQMMKTAQNTGLEVSEVVIQKDYLTKSEEENLDSLEYTLECLPIYANIGVKTVNLFTGPRPWIKASPKIGIDLSESDAWEKVYAAYDKIVASAEKYKINIAIENVWGMLCHDYYTVRPLIDHYNSPYLGVNFDPSHDILYGNTDMKFLVEGWGDKIKHVHVKDAAGVAQNGKFIFPLIGEGFVDWDQFSASLKKIGYIGALSVEFESFIYQERILGGSIEEAARLSFYLMEKILK